MTLLYKKIRYMLSLCDVFFKSSLSFLVPQHLFNIMNLFSALKKKLIILITFFMKLFFYLPTKNRRWIKKVINAI